MRILAIRGENLASLASPFDIELTAEPLAGTGLFAITGETGAGKSTILDALCLALYGEYPRIAIRSSEDAPDPGGAPLGIKDPRAILRRGAGSGYAEADFIGRDGDCYRARWAVNRARGRANGRLQNETRLLSRLGGDAVATGTRPVREAVEQRTGLTFDQFRRTVLLAQGEFDAFLLADTSERAELLEKITGTDIYARISMRIAEGCKQQRARLLQLEEIRAQLGVMAEEDRAALLAERDTLTSRLGAIQASESELQARIRKAERLREAMEEAARAAEQVENAVTQFEAADADRQLCAELDAIAPLRPLFGWVQTAQEHRRKASEAEVLEAGKLSEAVAAFELATGAAAAAEHQWQEAERLCIDFAPQWTRAEELDIEIRGAESELRNAQTSAAFAETALLETQRDLEALEVQQQDIASHATRCTEQLAACSGHALLADAHEEIVRHLDKRGTLVAERRKTLREMHEYERALTRGGEAIASVERQLQQHQEERNRLSARIEQRRGELVAIGLLDLRKWDAALRSHEEALRDVAPLCRTFADEAAALAEAESEQRSLAAELDAAQARLRQAETELEQLGRARAKMQPLSDLAEDAASEAAMHLRVKLLAGAPCPVCGSQDHPRANDTQFWDARLAELRERQSELQRRWTSCESARMAELGTVTSISARLQAIAKRSQVARVRLSGASDAYAAAAARLASSASACGCSEPPATLEQASFAKIAALLQHVTELRTGLAPQLGRADELQEELAGLRASGDKWTVEIEAATNKLSALRIERHDLDLKQTKAQATYAEMVERIGSIDREQSAALAAVDLSPADLDSDPETAIAAVRRLGREYRTLREQLSELDTALTRLEPQIAGKRSSHRHALAERDKTAAVVAERQADLELKQTARTKLLDGEPTSAHRARMQMLRQATAESFREAREAAAETGKRRAATEAYHVAAVRAHKDAVAAHAEAERQLSSALAGLGLPEERLQSLLAVSAGEHQSLRRRLDELEAAVAAARAALDTRNKDAEALIARGESFTDIAEAREKIARLENQRSDIHRGLGTIDSTIKADDAKRTQADVLSGEIAAARQECALWEDIDAAIGSVNGNKFRSFAQGITLDHLVQLANLQLRGLSPRYQLGRAAEGGLALHVVDRDMGDEVRSTRSLSGGERFLVSLALALGLSQLEGGHSFVDTLFIDEGFGSLDGETLDVAIDALEALQGQNRKVGIITHVAAMVERIAVQVRVEKRGQGRSSIRIVGGDYEPASLAR